MILIIGDPHYDKNNELETDIFQNDIIYIIENRPVEYVVILGDMMHYHGVIYTPVMMRLHRLIEEISKRVPLFILIGNHDRVSNKVFLTDEHVFNGYKHWPNVTIVDICYVLEWKERKICMMPFVPDGTFMYALEQLKINPEDMDLFLAHQEFKESKIQAKTHSKTDSWPRDFPRMYSGHIHEQEIVSGNLVYIGTPYQQNFGESTNKGVFLMDENLELEMIELNIPKKIHYTISHDELDNFVVEPNVKLKLTVEGPVDVIKKKLERPELRAKYVGVKFEFVDSAKVRKVTVKYDSNMSYTARLQRELRSNPQMQQIFDHAFSTEI